MSATPAERPRAFAVQEGPDKSVCPRCRIWRVNAGYLRETCGEGFRKPGCFVKPVTKL